MNTLINKFGWPVFASLMVVAMAACSSAPKKDPEPFSKEAQAANEAAELDESVESPGSGGSAVKEPLVSANGTKIDKKYQALAAAVRGGKGSSLIEESGKILAMDPNDPVALNTLALYHFRKRKTGAAKLLLSRALEKNQPTAALLNNLAVVLLEEGDQGGAIINLKKALRIDDAHAEALGNLGSLYVQGGDYARALHLLEQAYKKNRANTAIANNYAIALRVSKDYDSAKKVYDEILKQNSKDVAAHLNYAILLIDYMNKPKDGLALVYKVKFLETERKDVLSRANALEKKAKSELK